MKKINFFCRSLIMLISLIPTCTLAQLGVEPSKIVITLNDSLALRPEIFKIEYATDETDWQYRKGSGRTTWISSKTHIENANIRISRSTGEVMLVRIRFNPYSKLHILDLGFTPFDTIVYMTPPGPSLNIINDPKKLTLDQMFSLYSEDVLDDAIFVYTTHNSVDEAQITIYPNRINLGDTLYVQASCQILEKDTGTIGIKASVGEHDIEFSFGYDTPQPPASENQERIHWQTDAFIVPERPGIYLIRDGKTFERSYSLDTGGAFIIVE